MDCYCGGTAVTGATAVIVRCHGGHSGAATTPLRMANPRCNCGSFEHVQSFPRFMSYKHRSGTAPSV